MESFGPGKDGGIDFRFAMAEKDIVVQAKHYEAGGFRSLLRAAKREDSKVLNLAPSRYIFVTSLSLTPELKRKVIEAMPSTPVSAGDVIGREDLNNFLGLHPHVLRQHFKLWLTSTVVLDRILHSAVYNRTDAELDRIRQLVPRFVHNSSVAEAESILEDRGALIIAGEPGVGKTTLGRMLLWLHMEQNWKVFVVDDLQEAMVVSTAGEKRLIFLDDFLGQISLTNELLGKVDQRLPVFLDRVRNNKDLRFILTTRLYLLNQAQIQSDKLSSPRVNASEMILNVGVYTRIIRAKVVFNHIYFSDMVEEEKAKLLKGDFFLKMIDHRNFSPRLIDLLTSADYYSADDDSIQATVLRVLDNPSELWERPYRSHLSADARCLLWAIFFTGLYVSRELCLQLFKHILVHADKNKISVDLVSRFRTGLKELSGSFVEIGDKEISFANPGVRDYLSKVFIDDHLLPIVVKSVSTLYEFRVVWSFFRVNILHCRAQFAGHDLWVAAMGRIQSHWSNSAIESLRHILEMIEHLPGLDMNILLKKVIDDLVLQGIEPQNHYDCLFSLRQFKRLHFKTDSLLALACDALTNAAAKMLSGAGDNIAIEDIKSIANALEPLMEESTLHSAASNALHFYISGIEERLSDVESTEELETLRENFISVANSYGVRIAPTLIKRIQDRRENIAKRESEEDTDPYQQSGQQATAGKISDAEIKSMFSLMSTLPVER